MKLYDENKNYVGEIEKPEPIEQDERWWEAIEYRAPQIGENFISTDGTIRDLEEVWHGNNTGRWIASEIPRASKEQLKAIGMHEGNGGRPVVCKDDDVVWNGGGFTRLNDVLKAISENSYRAHIGHYRFVLVPKVQKEIHTNCEGCVHTIGGFRNWMNVKCETCFPMAQYNMERKNYTPAQPPCKDEYRLLKPDELIQAGDQYRYKTSEVWMPTSSIGFTVKSQSPLVYRRKIQQPPQPEDPRFTTNEIKIFVGQFYDTQTVVDLIDDRHVGIAAFTERRRG